MAQFLALLFVTVPTQLRSRRCLGRTQTAGIVFNITGGPDMTLAEVNIVSNVVSGLADPAANIIFGSVVDPDYNGELRVTLIATGFSSAYEDSLVSGKGVAGRAAPVAQAQPAPGAQQRAPAAAAPQPVAAGGLPWQKKGGLF